MSLPRTSLDMAKAQHRPARGRLRPGPDGDHRFLFGLAPALQATRLDLLRSLKSGSPSGRAGRSQARRALVVAEVALSLLLQVGATLLVRTLQNYQGVDAGFEKDSVVLFTMKHVHERYTPERLRLFCQELVESVRRLPRVRAAGLAETGPFSGRVGGNRPVASAAASSAGTVPAVVDRVSPGFLDSLGIRLLEGRDFSFADREGAPHVAIVDERVARQLFGPAGALGERIRIDVGGRTPGLKDSGAGASVRHAKRRSSSCGRSGCRRKCSSRSRIVTSSSPCRASCAESSASAASFFSTSRSARRRPSPSA